MGSLCHCLWLHCRHSMFPVGLPLASLQPLPWVWCWLSVPGKLQFWGCTGQDGAVQVRGVRGRKGSPSESLATLPWSRGGVKLPKVSKKVPRAPNPAFTGHHCVCMRPLGHLSPHEVGQGSLVVHVVLPSPLLEGWCAKRDFVLAAGRSRCYTCLVCWVKAADLFFCAFHICSLPGPPRPKAAPPEGDLGVSLLFPPWLALGRPCAVLRARGQHPRPGTRAVGGRVQSLIPTPRLCAGGGRSVLQPLQRCFPSGGCPQPCAREIPGELMSLP